jgi:intracellular sulfur oxidation DsrE/DsrF family protein
VTTTRRLFNFSSFLALCASGFAVTKAHAADEKPHRIVIHVGGSEASQMNVALSNIVNAAEHYAEIGKPVSIELVANGPGYTMVRQDGSPVKARIAEIHRKYPFVVFSACQKSRQGVAKTEGKTVDQIVEIPEVTDVPAGIVRLTELQEQGWSYVRA